MFNLGTKTVVLNSNANVTEANGVISQDSELLQSQQLLLRQEDKGVAKKMQWQVCTQSLRLHLMTILKRTTLYLVFAQKSIV
jgi:outer membrane biogenesis lipoprotein LolB